MELSLVRVIRAGPKDWCKVGIHLLRPSKQMLENAKEDAEAKGFPTIYVHNRFPTKTICARR